jgi:two-component system, NtrC family, response regulator AtoC
VIARKSPGAGTVLIIDGDVGSVSGTTSALDSHCRVLHAFSGEEGLRICEAEMPDLVIVDLAVPGLTALRVVDVLAGRGTTAVMVTGPADLTSAVEAMQLGASDYLEKPVDGEKLRSAVVRALEECDLRRVVAQPHVPAGPGTHLGASARMMDLARRVELAARCPETSVLILGESGTGKGHVARMLHAQSARARSPFVQVNCGGLSATFLDSELFGHEKGAFTDARETKPGLFEVANRGTIFLDEIGELALELQPKLLKVLEERRFRRLGGTREIEVSVRVVAATNRDLKAEVSAGRFREDLYYRLCVFPLSIPPLRERAREDVVELIQLSLADLRRRCPAGPERLSAKAMGLLVDYGWPGNVRELRNALEFALVLGHGADSIEPHHLPDHLRAPGALRADRSGWEAVTLDELERRHVERTLHHARGNRTLAAEKLGISRATLHAKIRAYGLEDVGRTHARAR